MPDFLSRFDNSGRTPRDEQVTALKWLSANWDKYRFHAIQAPCGVGKSGIAAAVQAATGGAIITPNNNLLSQYIETYPHLNYLKGRQAYQCESGITCEDRKDLKLKPCPNCPYVECRKKARRAEPTVFNPLSYHFLTNGKKIEGFKTLVVDEAHLLLDMLDLLVTGAFRYDEAKFPLSTDKSVICDWLSTYMKLLDVTAGKYLQVGDDKKAARMKAQAIKCEALEYGLREYPDRYVVYIADEPFRGKTAKYLHIEPIYTPSYIVTSFFEGFDKIVLLSATLPPSRVVRMTQGNYGFIDLDSPIPVKDRTVTVDSAGLTAKSTPAEVAAWITKTREAHGNPNTIVHVTYSMGKAVHKLLPGSLYHTPETKESVMAEFKASGGVWLAAACSEGVDLPGYTCRLNLIPILPFANVGGPVVAARLQAPGGSAHYASDTLTTFVQQCGRSTRFVGDYSTIVCGDGRVARLLRQCQPPQSFLKSVRFK